MANDTFVRGGVNGRNALVRCNTSRREPVPDGGIGANSRRGTCGARRQLPAVRVPLLLTLLVPLASQPARAQRVSAAGVVPLPPLTPRARVARRDTVPAPKRDSHQLYVGVGGGLGFLVGAAAGVVDGATVRGGVGHRLGEALGEGFRSGSTGRRPARSWAPSSTKSAGWASRAGRALTAPEFAALRWRR